MPGTYFKGDGVEANRAWELLGDASSWEMSGEASQGDFEHFRRFLDVLEQDPSPDTLAELRRLLDMDVYARWAALCAITGSVHTDDFHNQSFYLSPNRGLVEAVLWDSNSYGVHAQPDLPVDFIRHPIMDMVTRDPRWVHLRNRYMYDLLLSHASVKAVNAMIDKEFVRMLPDLKADVNLHEIIRTPAGWLGVPFPVSEIDAKRRELKQWVARRNRVVAEYFEKADVSIEPIAGDQGWVRVEVSGHVAVKVHVTDSTVPSLESESSELLYPGLSESLSQFESFRRFSTVPLSVVSYANPAPMVYRVRGSPGALRFINAITGEVVTPKRGYRGITVASRTLDPSTLSAPDLPEVVLGPGEVVIDRDMVLAEGQRLTIHAGTRVNLAGGVGIYARGRVLVKGTAEAPVVFGPLDQKPWGAFGVSGPHTSGSRFEHMYMSGGSFGTDGSIRFKGMLNVYNCTDVILRHCRFRSNQVGDDAVNLAESNILVADCLWDSALADGLDLDMCTGLVRDCTWRYSGNDGLDLMSCRVLVTGCRFIGSGDKGVSVGEGTSVVFRDCRFLNCLRGTEIKDGSRAFYERCQFDGNRIAVNAYQKKWVYRGGGTAILVNSSVINSVDYDASIKNRSALILFGTDIGRIEMGEDRIQIVSEMPVLWRDLVRSIEAGE